jgi:hypothetical protein
MVRLEAAPAFADAAFAQNDDLPSASERIHNHRPLLKCDPHILYCNNFATALAQSASEDRLFPRLCTYPSG